MKEGERKNRLKIWLAVLGSATLVLGAAYALVQQSARMAADAEPLSAAQNAKKMLADDANPAEIVPEKETDLRNGSNVFVIITDMDKKVLASSAILDGEAPLPPPGVFNYTESHGSDHFTWEPKKGVRLATQVLKYDDGKGGYIVAGKSLKQVEDNASRLALISLVAWLAVAVWTTGLLLFPIKAPRKKQ